MFQKKQWRWIKKKKRSVYSAVYLFQWMPGPLGPESDWKAPHHPYCNKPATYKIQFNNIYCTLYNKLFKPHNLHIIQQFHSDHRIWKSILAVMLYQINAWFVEQICIIVPLQVWY